ncbi:hypothetical protein MVEG_00371 [Podila verticillata NRRL 6337]|nr:hypothetical protein MVEG_00371 [Podila verticillata NRRL 6337]
MEASFLSTSGFRALIEKCPLLEVLHIDVSIFMLPNSIWNMLAAQCPRLRVLSVHHANAAGSLPEPKVLYEMFPNMEDVRVQPMITLRQQPVIKRHDALESLCLSTDLKGMEQRILLPFIESCSNNLKVLGGDVRLGCFRNKSLARALAKLGIFLNRLQYDDLPNELYTNDCDIAHLLSLSSDWTDLSNLRALDGVGPLTVAVVLDQCEHLETIDLGGRAKIMSADVQSILGLARCLMSICIAPGTPIVEAASLVAGPEWATTSLRVFSMRIDVEEESSRQRQLFQRLGLQKSCRNWSWVVLGAT